MHGLRAAVYGRAVLHRHIRCLGVPSLRSYIPLLQLYRATNRPVQIDLLRAVLISTIDPGLAISAYFHLHRLRAAVSGRADLQRRIGCFGRPSIQSSVPPMHVYRAINRSINYVRAVLICPMNIRGNWSCIPVFTCMDFARRCTGVPRCIDISDSSMCFQCDYT